jgi:ketosteroid isomerase-like protein
MDAIKDRGKYLAILKKAVDGTWKVYVDIWNSSLPAK